MGPPHRLEPANPAAPAPLSLPVAVAVSVSAGFATLGLEVLWARRLGLVFGRTVFAATAVLCAYTLGVALGAMLVGPRADRSLRPGRLLGLILLAVAGLGFLTHQYAIPLAGWGNGRLFGAGPSSWVLRCWVRFGWSVLALLPACLALGAVLPALARATVSTAGEMRWRMGLVWATATAGAVGGVLLTAFCFLPRWGRTSALLLLISPCSLAGFALVLADLLGIRRDGGSPSKSRSTPAELGCHPARSLHTGEVSSRAVRTATHLAVVLAGAATLAAETLYLRFLFFFLAGTTRTLAVVLAAYLGGLFLGSTVVLPAARRTRWVALWLGWSFVLAGLAIIGSISVLARFDSLVGHLGAGAGTALAVVVSGVPALLAGMCVPFLLRLVARARGAGSGMGCFSAGYNFGAAAGTAAVALLVVPILGLQRALLAVGLVWLLLGAVALVGTGPRPSLYAARLACLAGLALAGLFLPDLHLFRTFTAEVLPGSTVVFQREGPDAVVTVLETPYRRTRSLLIDRMIQGDSSELGRLVQWRQGLIPLLLHPNPRRVCVIGLGTGATAHAARMLCTGRLDVVEISPGVVEALPYLPPDLNGRLARGEDLDIVVEDGRSFLRNCRGRYDVILVDLLYPHLVGAGGLFSREFYLLCARRLQPGGVLCHWLPAWQMGEEELASVVRAFSSLGEESIGRGFALEVWCALYSARQPVVGLIGRKGPPLGVEALRARLRRAAGVPLVRRTGLAGLNDLLAHWVCSTLDFGRGILLPAESDERPLLEFRLPGRMLRGAGSANLSLILRSRSRLAESWLREILAFVRSEPALREAFDRRRQAVGFLIRGQLAGVRGRYRQELAAYHEAVRLGWRDPALGIFERQARYALLLEEAEGALLAGEWRRVVVLARRASEVSPDQPDAFGLLAEALIALSRNAEALRAADRAVFRDPVGVRWLLARAMARFNLRQYAAALRDVERVLRLQPDNSTAERLRRSILRRLSRAGGGADPRPH